MCRAQGTVINAAAGVAALAGWQPEKVEEVLRAPFGKRVECCLFSDSRCYSAGLRHLLKRAIVCLQLSWASSFVVSKDRVTQLVTTAPAAFPGGLAEPIRSGHCSLGSLHRTNHRHGARVVPEHSRRKSETEMDTNRSGENKNDLEIVYSYLHGMEALSNLREHQLRMMCETVRYERHEANEVLYYPDDIGSCWYILLSGSVFIKESMFLPRSSFGKRSAGSLRRGCECIVLEPSEMIVVDYMDENEEYFQRQASHRQSRRRFRKINQKGERQTIIDTVDPYPAGKPPVARGYHTKDCVVLAKDSVCASSFSESPQRSVQLIVV
ncbi:hypothetical protein AOLI_G00065050 [Acnodon oligacanthus]